MDVDFTLHKALILGRELKIKYVLLLIKVPFVGAGSIQGVPKVRSSTL